MAAREEIEAMLAERGEALLRCDLVGVMRFYVEDCELVVGEMPTMKGLAAVSEFYRSMFSEGTIQTSFVIEDLRVQGPLAVFYARELLTVKLREESVADQYAMRHMAVLTCESGGWKFARIMAALEGPGTAEVDG